ncbi:DNA mismatch repair protein [Rhizina undulata]
MSHDAPSIKPLPDSVKARLRSTLNITSLSDAISELIQNSLDAEANNIKVQVNLSRNSCVVEDDGVGIVPRDLERIGEMNSTSKYPPPPNASLLGIRGEALASLAIHSLLTLTTRHLSYRSTHTVRFSYSKRAYIGPAPEHQRLSAHGTIVRIEGLWGDMPVRLKARQVEDTEREWEDVKRVVVQLLLTPQGKGVSVVVRDENGVRKLSVRGGRSPGLWETGVLEQAYGKEMDKSAWEIVQAKQGGVKIEGLMSTQGTGSREHQYLFINNHPLPPATTLLHSEVNRIFNTSTFGVIEDESSKPRKNESNILKGRNTMKKGVDKWGMFILRIESSRDDFQLLGGEGGTEGKSGVEGENLKEIIDLLQKLIHEFLKTHHFSPNFLSTGYKKDEKRTRSSTPSILEIHERQPERSTSSTPSSTRNITPNPLAAAKGIRGSLTALGNIGAWSKVKSAKIDDVEEAGRLGMGSRAVSPYPFGKVGKGGSNALGRAVSMDRSDVGKENEVMGDGNGDDIIRWQDPVSRKSYQVNARTGNTTSTMTKCLPLNGAKRSASAISGGRLWLTKGGDGGNKRQKKSKNVDINGKEPGEWVESLLKTWETPVFSPPEAPIPQIPIQALTSGPSSSLHRHHCGCDSGQTGLFREATSQRLGKLTKEGLRNAHVIAQVDRKYILIRMQGLSKEIDSNPDHHENQSENKSNELLVIVDQHAADERVRVEKLFRELCPASSENIPPDSTQSGPLGKELIFKVSRHDGELMAKYWRVFEEWGIGYDAVKADASSAESTLRIKTLPKSVAERCGNEPALAIDMVRKHIYELHEKGSSGMRYSSSRSEEQNGDGDAWVGRIGRAPRGLVEMVNSRACRSAVMFNDPLTIEECATLVRKLGQCKFPFQCAHGRPSMIPLVDLGIPETLSSGETVAEKGAGFKEAFGQWKKSGFGGCVG